MKIRAVLGVALVSVILPLACGGKVEEAGTAGGGVSKGGAGGYPGTGGHDGGYGGWGGGTAAGGTATGGYPGYGGQGGWPGSGGTGGSGGALGEKLGHTCHTDADCKGLVCLTPESKGGAPARGYCTRECTADMSVCDSIGGVCVDLAEGMPTISYCMQRCTIGPPLEALDGKLDPSKCWGRNTVACTELSSGEAACMPRCQTDDDCAGMKCDHESGMCLITAYVGMPMGSACNAWALSQGDAGAECDGVCIGMQKTKDAGPNDVAYFCSQPCVMNDFTGCGFQDPTPTGACLLMEDYKGSGDQAWCLPMCDIDSDCLDKAENGSYCDTSVIQNGWPRGFCLY